MELNAIRNLYNKDCTKDGDVVLIEGNEPTDIQWEAIRIEVARIQAEYEATQYQRDRASAYPSMQEQLDMQYWDGVNGTTTWQDAITTIKTENPKP
tara:strand:+ start:760 stop:1047 length:288 start_codon:yes stop_codon:yes gene_type:complete